MTRYYYQAGIIRVCVDDITEARIGGRLYSPILAEPMVFGDIGSLVLQMEEMYDAQGFPDAFQRIRCFVPQSAKTPLYAVVGERCQRDDLLRRLTAVREHSGRMATFELYVTTRQNATWQGWIDWLEQGKRQYFRSVLDLLRLTDAYLIRGQTPVREQPAPRLAIAT